MNQSRLTIIALLAGEPGSLELHTLHELARQPVRLHVVCAEKVTAENSARRLKRLLRRHGLSQVGSRLVGSQLIGRWEEGNQRRRLDRLFDRDHLIDWWRGSGVVPVAVPHLNHPAARQAIAALEPDLMVRVSGGLLQPETFSLARLATLNLHHGRAPYIRGMWSIPWGIVAERPDWIGATLHMIDAGIDTGRVLWRGAPQLAPGDTGDTLYFRAHCEAVAALAATVRLYAAGKVPPTWPDEDPTPGTGPSGSVYRSAPGVGAWLKYLCLGRGARSRMLLEQALQ
jgi:hypothetical protein